MSETESKEPSRRDFIYVATAAAGAITTGAAVWPLIDQMNPSADVQALASIEVDVVPQDPFSSVAIAAYDPQEDIISKNIYSCIYT